MATIEITLPNSLKAWIDQQVRDGRYASASDYLCDLIRQDQQRQKDTAAREDVLNELVADAQENDMRYSRARRTAQENACQSPALSRLRKRLS